MTASLPELQNRTRSIDATREQMSSANSICVLLRAGQAVPAPMTRLTASTIGGKAEIDDGDGGRTRGDGADVADRTFEVDALLDIRLGHVADTTKYAIGNIVEFQDDGEQCLVTALASATTLTVIRNFNYSVTSTAGTGTSHSLSTATAAHALHPTSAGGIVSTGG
mgnify:CR=1 FL=1